jgi:hypothetical protein
MARASASIKESVVNLISNTNAELKCTGTSWYKWYGFYVNATHRKKLFAVIMLGKNTATVCFRVKAGEFKDGNENVRYVKGFFFPSGTERRIYVEGSDVNHLLEYLKHAYEVTKQIQRQKVPK